MLKEDVQQQNNKYTHKQNYTGKERGNKGTIPTSAELQAEDYK